MLANFAAVSIRVPSETCQLKSVPIVPFFYTTIVFRTVSPNNPRWQATKFQFILKAFSAVIMWLKVQKQVAILMALFALAIIP